jgi:hypothetical protein
VETLVMFNTVMGVAAGAALLMVPRFWALVRGEQEALLLMGHGPINQAGWAAAFGTLGLVLFPLSLVMTVAHPLHVAKSYIDTIFGEPSLVLGALLLASAWYLARGGGADLDAERLRAAILPIGWVIFFLGIILAWCAAAIIRFDAVSSAPVEEPITGLLNGYPVVENLFFAIILYGLAALGCLVFPAATHGGNRVAWQILYWSWTVSGFAFAMFSALNFYTHTGLLVNVSNPDSPPYRW